MERGDSVISFQLPQMPDRARRRAAVGPKLAIPSYRRFEESTVKSQESNVFVQTRRFLDFPGEVRNRIYFLLLRPDLQKFGHKYLGGLGGWKNAVGCTQVLVLNKTIYREAISFLLTMDITIAIHGRDRGRVRGRRLFRDPFANGEPNMFHMNAKSSAVFIPPTISEIEFIKLRKVTLQLGYGENNRRLKSDFVELCAAVSKNSNLEQVHLSIHNADAGSWIDDQDVRHYSGHPSQEVTDRLCRTLEKLIRLSICNSVLLSAAEDKKVYPSARQSTQHEWLFETDPYHDPVVSWINSHGELQISNSSLKTRNHITKKTTWSHYHLTPECRSCYRPFSTKSQLQQHLGQQPKHKIDFQRKQYNAISPYAQTTGQRHTCLYCGRGYQGRAGLEEHCKKFNHYRDREQGIVPKFKRDNHWYRCAGTNNDDD